MEISLKRQLTQFEWLQLPMKARDLFIQTFDIPRTGGAIVNNNVLQSDGHTMEDLSRVSLKALQEYLGTTEDHWDKLLQLTINKMENPNVTPKEYDFAPEPDVRPESPTVGKRGRKAKVKQTT